MAVALTACGGSSSSLPKPKPTRTLGRTGGVLPNPTFIPTPKGLKLPTPVPGTPPAHLVTPAPAPTPTTIPASDFTASIHGTVSDAKSGSPISGATVVVGVNLRRVKTDAYGQYHASFPANADVPVTVNAQGFGGGLAIGRLGSHKTTVVNFKLNRVNKKGVAPPSLPQLFGQK